MSWRDRPYAGDPSYGQPEMRIQFRKPSSMVMWLIIANVAAYILVRLFAFTGFDGNSRLGLSLADIKNLYIWQIVTYMFMHASPMHLLFNMIGLYVFGTEFEKAFGKERFLQFYGLCGIFGGIAYLFLGFLSVQTNLFAFDYAETTLVGASGAVYGLLIAAIIFFPHIQIIFLIFPMPIRVFGLIVALMLFLNALSGSMTNLGGEVCHVAGALTGLAVLKAWGMMPRIRFGSGSSSGGSWGTSRAQKRRDGAWQKRQKQLAEEAAEVDRILQKVSDHGIASLTRREKKILAQATKRQQSEERDLGRL